MAKTNNSPLLKILAGDACVKVFENTYYVKNAAGIEELEKQCGMHLLTYMDESVFPFLYVLSQSDVDGIAASETHIPLEDLKRIISASDLSKVVNAGQIDPSAKDDTNAAMVLGPAEDKRVRYFYPTQEALERVLDTLTGSSTIEAPYYSSGFIEYDETKRTLRQVQGRAIPVGLLAHVPVERLPLQQRVKNTLIAAGINNLLDLMVVKEEALLKLPNLGRTGTRTIIDLMMSMGF
jgi:hypothetical protein